MTVQISQYNQYNSCTYNNNNYEYLHRHACALPEETKIKQNRHTCALPGTTSLIKRLKQLYSMH